MNSMPLCRDCKHFCADPGKFVPLAPTCLSPRLPLNPVTGELADVSAQRCRIAGNQCGPAGVWFEPKPVRRSWFGKLLPSPAPIDMVLYCPECWKQHIDLPDEYGWTNPPHRSHFCSACGHIWRPADVPTNGVRAIKTRGKKDKQ